MCYNVETSNRLVISTAIVDAIYPGTQANFWDSVPEGERRNFSGSEWAGATFYNKWLFVNIQSPGITIAITGPWENGSLNHGKQFF